MWGERKRIGKEREKEKMRGKRKKTSSLSVYGNSLVRYIGSSLGHCICILFILIYCITEESSIHLSIYLYVFRWAFCPINIRRILARDKRRKCLATGSEELSWLSVCVPKWCFMTSLAKNILRFSPFWAPKNKPPSRWLRKEVRNRLSCFDQSKKSIVTTTLGSGGYCCCYVY